MEMDHWQRRFFDNIRRFAQIAAHMELPGLTKMEFYTMNLLLRSQEEGTEAPGVKSLAGRLNCTAPGVSRVLGHLEERGLIRRVFHSQDRRGTRVVVTPEGKALTCRIRQEMMARFQRVYEVMGPQDMETFLTLWNKLMDIMEEEYQRGKEETLC